MITYEKYSKNLWQKALIILLELITIGISYYILFNNLGEAIINLLHIPYTGGNHLRHSLLFTANIIIFLAYLPTILIFVKRKISWEEAFSVPLAFALYYIGFSLLGYNTLSDVSLIDWLGAALVITGLSLHLTAEWQRYKFKQNPQNQGKLMTTGLWSLSRHINYFGDLLWVSGMAMITRNWWSVIIVLFLFVFFYFFNIPVQEKYLQQKYSEEFTRYKKNVKALIPWIL